MTSSPTTARFHYGGTLGAFGDALGRSGSTWTLVSDDPETALAVADHTGSVDHAVRGGAPEIRSALDAGVDVVIADASSTAGARGHAPHHQRRVHGRGERELPAAVGPPRRVRRVTPVRPRAGRLVSPSTKQPGFVELVDVAPTVLDRAGLPLAAGDGRQAGATPPARSRPSALRAEDVRSHQAPTRPRRVHVVLHRRGLDRRGAVPRSAPTAVGSRRVARGAAARVLPDDVGAVVAGRRARRRPGVLGDRSRRRGSSRERRLAGDRVSASV